MIYKFLLNGLMTAVVFVSAFLSFTLDNYVTIFVSLFVLFFWWIPRIRKLIEKDYHKKAFEGVDWEVIEITEKL